MNWVQTESDTISQITFEDGLIKYTPTESAEKIRQMHKRFKKEDLALTEIKCSDYFENGTIEFDFCVGNKDSLLTLAIGDILVGLNSVYSPRLFSIRKWLYDKQNVESLAESGVKGVIEQGKYHSFKTEVYGSTINFYINGVQVCQAITKIERDQPFLSFFGEKEILIKNFKIQTQKRKAFVIMQFSEDYNNLYKDVIKPISCDRFGYDCIRGDDFLTGDSIILNDIINSIKDSSVIIADITPDNPNVFYEVGFAHALNKPTILLSDKKREKLPFDVSGFRTIFYDNTIGGRKAVEDMLVKHLENIQQK